MTKQRLVIATGQLTKQIMKHLKISPYCNIDYYGCETCTCDGRIENMTFKMRCSRRFMGIDVSRPKYRAYAVLNGVVKHYNIR